MLYSAVRSANKHQLSSRVVISWWWRMWTVYSWLSRRTSGWSRLALFKMHQTNRTNSHHDDSASHHDSAINMTYPSLFTGAGATGLGTAEFMIGKPKHYVVSISFSYPRFPFSVFLSHTLTTPNPLSYARERFFGWGSKNWMKNKTIKFKVHLYAICIFRKRYTQCTIGSEAWEFSRIFVLKVTLQ